MGRPQPHHGSCSGNGEKHWRRRPPTCRAEARCFEGSLGLSVQLRARVLGERQGVRLEGWLAGQEEGQGAPGFRKHQPWTETSYRKPTHSRETSDIEVSSTLHPNQAARWGEAVQGLDTGQTHSESGSGWDEGDSSDMKDPGHEGDGCLNGGQPDSSEAHPRSVVGPPCSHTANWANCRTSGAGITHSFNPNYLLILYSVPDSGNQDRR